MHPLVYDVAVSIDGYISGPGGDISGFAQSGPVVEDYRARLAGYATAIMGRKTYEFGYRFGLLPGQNPYPHMQTLICTTGLSLPRDAAVRCIGLPDRDALRRLKRTSEGPIYLVGGGDFASALLATGMLDRIVLKRAPILLGGGTPLFSSMPLSARLRCRETRDYGDGYLLQTFDVEHGHAG